MRNIFYVCMLMLLCSEYVIAQSVDSVKHVSLAEVVVSESRKTVQQKKNAMTMDLLSHDYFREHQNGNFVQALEHTAGIRSMNIGMGFSKPVIRGMGFSRIAVSENGIKQEGQQWGADHGLEIDAFNIDNVHILKGPASLLYGSDAMGGVIEIQQPYFPVQNSIFGSATLLAKSVNDGLGASVMLGFKRNRWMSKMRYSEQHFSDYRVPTNSVVYLTMKLPIYDHRLKNTAGFERDFYWMSGYKHGGYQANLVVSDAYQKTGFFEGAHGIPDASRLERDGSHRNVSLPFSKVNHLKIMTHQQYTQGHFIYSVDAGYQYNHREEWSLFHTHYDAQPVPLTDPDKELVFRLHTGSAVLRMRWLPSDKYEQTVGLDVQGQKNTIGGYGFLLPEYRRYTLGGYYVATYRPNRVITVTGGMRYDYGHNRIQSFKDIYLVDYLTRRHYDDATIASYQWRSHAISKNYSDVSGSVGIVFAPTKQHLMKINLGRSFRLPGVNELSSNGIHHGAFRHEQGDAMLKSERGWQLDAFYQYTQGILEATVAPFISLYDNYIFLRPTGEWSILPHAGQIYRYSEANATLMGGEITFKLHLTRHLKYDFSGEYIYTNNNDAHTALTFSPSPSMRNTFTWQASKWHAYIEWQQIGSQNRVSHNEDKTAGACLFHLGGSWDVHISDIPVLFNITVNNLFDTRYYNHLSFYRKIEIPEAGRNIQLTINIPFNKLIK